MTEADAIADFINQVKAQGITTVVLAWQDEWDLTDDRGFGPVQRTRLLAYHAGELLTLDLRGEQAARSSLGKRLAKAGLQVEQRRRNVS